MKIATIEDRYPVTQALAFGIEMGVITPDREGQLRKELEDLVVESAKKFVGFGNVQSIRKALDITLGIISLAVVDTTNGEEDLGVWAEYLVTTGLKGAAKKAIVMVKTIDENFSAALLKDGSPEIFMTVKEQLVLYALERSRDGSRRWTGYQRFKSVLRTSQRMLSVAKVAGLLVQKLTGFRLEVWLSRLNSRFNSLDAVPMADDLITTCLFRLCADIPGDGELILHRKEFQQVRSDYEEDKSSWMKKAKERYKTVKEEIPPELRRYMLFDDTDWFDRRLSAGPPKVPKKWGQVTMNDYTGIYYYDPFK